MDDLTTQVKALVADGLDLAAGSLVEDRLHGVMRRLDEPLRVAIAGRVKAGKSTLLNALVGEQLAPTDAGECTKIVTWYKHGPGYRATLQMLDGSSRPARFTREGGSVEVDLEGASADSIDRIVIEWPSRRLADLTLIDTPGVASINTSVSDRALAFLTPDDERPVEADAVLYLMRHMHAEDLSFLESFHDDELSNASPINAIGLLSRADEVGVGRPNAMRVAERIAARYRSDPKLRRLCQTVKPIGGLLAETAATLTQDEFRALEDLAGLDRKRVEQLMLSTDRFVADLRDCSIPPLVRRHLLDRFGLFGIRVALPLIRQGRASSAGDLADALAAKSGIVSLRDELLDRFAGRRDVLRARSALLAVERLMAAAPPEVGLRMRERLLPDMERIKAGAHAFAEISLLNDYRRGLIPLSDADGVEAERLLGTEGTGTAVRLGLDPSTDQEQVRVALLQTIERWRRKGEHPLASREVTTAAAVLVRTCEGALAATHLNGGRRAPGVEQQPGTEGIQGMQGIRGA